jgi:spore coat protein U-like protein
MVTKVNILCRLLIMIYGALGVTSANSASVSKTVNIVARYNVTCAIAGVDPLKFGALAPGSSTEILVTSALIVSCTGGTPFGVWVPLSSNANNSQRRMISSDSSGTKYISYNLYSNYAGRTLMPTQLTSTGYTSGSGGAWLDYRATVVALEAVIPSGQTLSAGHYSDTIVVNVSY